VRWEDRAEAIRNKNGGEYVTKSRVFAGQDLSLDGYLYLGESDEVDPRTVDGAYEIQQISKIPDLSNLETIYTAYL
jgi:hypothetical protein